MARLCLTEAEKEQKKRHIMDSSVELMATQGYEHTTMQQISKKSGVAIGTLYLYFNNKLEIYTALFEEALDLLESTLNVASSIPATDTKARICLLLQSYIHFYQHHNHQYRILFSGFFGKNAKANENVYLKNRIIKILKQLEKPIIKGVEEGIIKPCDTFELVISLWAMFDGVLMLPQKTNITSLGDQFQNYYTYGIEIILNGILIKDESKQK
ncbi:TetR/AcrR family transcriptional regulator [Proteinivorax hydrogeniformans]